MFRFTEQLAFITFHKIAVLSLILDSVYALSGQKL